MIEIGKGSNGAVYIQTNNSTTVFKVIKGFKKNVSDELKVIKIDDI